MAVCYGSDLLPLPWYDTVIHPSLVHHHHHCHLLLLVFHGVRVYMPALNHLPTDPLTLTAAAASACYCHSQSKSHPVTFILFFRLLSLHPSQFIGSSHPFLPHSYPHSLNHPSLHTTNSPTPPSAPNLMLVLPAAGSSLLFALLSPSSLMGTTTREGKGGGVTATQQPLKFTPHPPSPSLPACHPNQLFPLL